MPAARDSKGRFVKSSAVVITDRTAEALKTMQGLHADRLRDFAEEMVDEAKDIVPVDTGNLRDSIDFTEEREQGLVKVFTQTGYGAWVELGTSRMAARPYLAPAFAHAWSVIVDRGGRVD
ncbi:MAG: HK97 gp10 family phage protein [Candidatus Hydrogenedentes bacterium]|nr:HK97 gp10 family phage protein [Candidatus Hydrogenedentota bacterium]